MQEQAEADAAPIDCWLGGAQVMKETCLLESEKERFVIRHPDGGFRRFGPDPAGGYMVLDGAEELTESYGFDRDYIEFVVGADRYSMPLSILPERPSD